MMSYFEDFKAKNPEQFKDMPKEQEERTESMINAFGTFMCALWNINGGGYNDSVDRKDVENV